MKLSVLSRKATALAAIVFAPPARADMGPMIPGIVERPIKFIFEMVEAYPEHRFWLVSFNEAIRLDREQGHPKKLVTNRLNTRVSRDFIIVAATAKEVEKRGQGWSPTWSMMNDKESAGLQKSYRSRTIGDVPFYDSRDEVVVTYRLEIDGGGTIQILETGRDSEPLQARLVRYIVGLALFIAFALGGLWLIRRVRRRSK